MAHLGRAIGAECQRLLRTALRSNNKPSRIHPNASCLQSSSERRLCLELSGKNQIVPPLENHTEFARRDYADLRTFFGPLPRAGLDFINDLSCEPSRSKAKLCLSTTTFQRALVRISPL